MNSEESAKATTGHQGKSRIGVKVVYIAGWTRSGSTLLDNLLGEIWGFFSTGELRAIWDAGLDRGWLCGCGSPLPKCDLWKAVLDRAFGSVSENPVREPARVRRLQQEAVRLRHITRLLRQTPGHSAGWSSLDAYLQIMSRLYMALSEVTGARVVVDSSKLPQDAAALRLVPGVDPYLVHLVRDPRAVAYSMQRKKLMQSPTMEPVEMPRSTPAASAAGWLRINLATEAVRRSYGREHSLLVRYEDLATRPRQVVGVIAEMLNEATDGLVFADDRTAELHGNHTVWGNPSRFATGPVRVQADDEWVRSMKPRHRLASTAVAFPLLKRYRYRVNEVLVVNSRRRRHE